MSLMKMNKTQTNKYNIMKNRHVFASFLTVAMVLFISSCQPAKENKEEVIQTKQYAIEVADCLMPGVDDSLRLTVDIDFLESTSAIPDTVLTKIQQRLIAKSFGEPYMQYNDMNMIIEKFHEDVLREYRLDYVPLYEQMKEEEGEDVSVNLNNEHMLMVYPMTLQGNVLCYVVERYLYLGGAHGINNRLLLNFDITTGQTLTEQDLFTDDFFSKIHDLLVLNLVRQRDDMSLIEDVQNSDYEVDAIKPNGNFYFASDGLIYIYNPYEIGPYYLGETNILVPTEEIKPFLKEEWQNIFAE